jgi:hypothetical protein
MVSVAVASSVTVAEAATVGVIVTDAAPNRVGAAAAAGVGETTVSAAVASSVSVAAASGAGDTVTAPAVTGLSTVAAAVVVGDVVTPVAVTDLATVAAARGAGLTVVSVRRGDQTLANPEADFRLQAADLAYVFGEHRRVLGKLHLFRKPEPDRRPPRPEGH